MDFKYVLSNYRKQIEKLYWWLGWGINLEKGEDIEMVERDYESLTLTVNVGWNGEAYLWYMDECRNLAINVCRGALTTDTQAILDWRVPSDWYDEFYGDFTDDEEKMLDFPDLSMDEFLRAYPEIREQEYLNTAIVLQKERV